MKSLFRLALLLVFVPTAAMANPCREESSFYGFSANEQGFAESVHVTCQLRKGVTDRFTLARVFDSATGQVKGTFFTADPDRTLANGAVVSISTPTVMTNYSAYHNALRQAAWRKVLHVARFHHVRHKFEDDVVRFRAINDSVESIYVHDGLVTVRAHEHQPLAFVVVARTKDGEHVDVASVHGAVGEQVRLEFFFAPSGRTVLVRVHRAHGPSQWLPRGAPLPGPIDSAEIGALNVMQWSSESARRDYDSVGDGKHSDEIEDFIDDAFRL